MKSCKKADGEQFEHKKWLSNIRQSVYRVVSALCFAVFGANDFQRAKVVTLKYQ